MVLSYKEQATSGCSIYTTSHDILCNLGVGRLTVNIYTKIQNNLIAIDRDTLSINIYRYDTQQQDRYSNIIYPT